MTEDNPRRRNRVYLDCPAGIAGDMLLGALLDLGASLPYVRAGLQRLELSEPWTLETEEVFRAGIRARRALVTVSGEPADVAFQETSPGDAGPPAALNHRRDDADGLKPHHHVSGTSSRDRPHDRGGHSREHRHGDNGHGHVAHRPYAEIRKLLEGSDLPARVRQRSLAVFAALAEAEGAVHGVAPDQVHFHEVGSTDAIIDVVGCCLALEDLGIDNVEASPLHLGSGFVTAAHGRLPIPAPATLRLLEGLPAYQTDITGELTTPTGAALIRALCDRVGPMGLGQIEGVGHGAGSKDRIVPNMVRALLLDGEQHDRQERDEVIELACNIDDMNPQLFAGVLDALLNDGALDVWVEPVVMKKGRPGHVVRALCHPQQREKLSSLLLRETTTLGVRAHKASRMKLDREWIEVEVAGGKVRVKLGLRGTEVWNIAPEYDDCASLATRLEKPLKLIIDEAKAAAWMWLSAGAAAAFTRRETDGS